MIYAWALAAFYIIAAIFSWRRFHDWVITACFVGLTLVTIVAILTKGH